MEKELLIITKSSKNQGYCVVGYDIHNKQLIRLTSSDEKSINSLLKKHITYKDGKELECEDIVRVKLIKATPKEIHNEDWLIDENVKITKIRNGNITEIKDIIEVNSNFIFENTREYLTLEEAKRQEKSIIVAFVKNIELFTTSSGDKVKTKINFIYNNKPYTFFSVTDPNFYNQNQKYEKAIIVFSLPNSSDPWVLKNNKCFKFAAKIFLL